MDSMFNFRVKMDATSTIIRDLEINADSPSRELPMANQSRTRMHDFQANSDQYESPVSSSLSLIGQAIHV